MDFNKLNTELYQESAASRFAKKPTDYDRGYMKINDWLADLCFHFEKKRKTQEKHDEDEFKVLLLEYRDKINELTDSDYKNGLLKAMSKV